MPLRTVITGTGSYIPHIIKTNSEFAVQDFYDEGQRRIELPATIIAEKFKGITGIEERRYAPENINASDLAVFAATAALDDSGTDPETLDQIVVAHNFGDVLKHTIQTDMLPALASRVKNQLGIKNPNCVAHDIIFGCPGWLQALIHTDAFFKAGLSKKALLIGAETLSRVIDIYDRDSMIFSDGAGACVAEAIEGEAHSSGFLGSSTQSHCNVEAGYLVMGKSNFPYSDPRIRYMKMKGRKVYEYAMKHVPLAMKDCLEKSGVEIQEVKKFILHQANEKMDQGFINELYKLYGITEIPAHIMPMSIHKYGNSSVATIPTLFDLVGRGQLENQSLAAGDVVVFASVGAGMNINAVCYRV
ncbi:MAG: ketoacyl-ACP synthase III [Bacteroidota bacterium]